MPLVVTHSHTMGTLIRMKDVVRAYLMIRVAARSRQSNRQVESGRERFALFKFPNLELGQTSSAGQDNSSGVFIERPLTNA
jgi:hypothetical protein